MKDSKGGCLPLLGITSIVVSALMLGNIEEPNTLKTRDSTEYKRTTADWVIPHLVPSDTITKPKTTIHHSKGITLYNQGKAIETGLTSEEIVNQLSLDYQDLYDYYGGAEEIF